jgi:hypothetical protein
MTFSRSLALNSGDALKFVWRVFLSITGCPLQCQVGISDYLKNAIFA